MVDVDRTFKQREVESFPSPLSIHIESILATVPRQLLVTQLLTQDKPGDSRGLALADEAKKNPFIQEAARLAITDALKHEQGRLKDYLSPGNTMSSFVVNPNLNLYEEINRVGLARIPNQPIRLAHGIGEFVRQHLAEAAQPIKRDIKFFDITKLEEKTNEFGIPAELATALMNLKTMEFAASIPGENTVVLAPFEIDHPGINKSKLKTEQHVAVFIVHNPHESLDEGLNKYGLGKHENLLLPIGTSYLLRHATLAGLMRVPQPVGKA